jgi:GNAT superfamily N-acetyltransferase
MFNYRVANETDIEDLLVMLKAFHGETPYKNVPWDADDASAFLFGLLDSEGIYVATDSDGYLIGCVGFESTSLPFNAQYWVQLEKFLYVYPHYRNTTVGTALLKYAETDITNTKAVCAIALSSLSSSPPHVGQWYESQGYRKVESCYWKEVG